MQLSRVITILCIIFSAFFYFDRYRVKHQLTDCQTRFAETIMAQQAEQHELETIHDRRKNEISYGGISIDSTFVTLSGNDPLPINQALIKSYLIFYFPENNCQSCIELEFQKINKLISENPETSIVVLTDTREMRDIEILKSAHTINCPVYSVSGKLSQRAAVMSRPFYFLYHPRQPALDHLFIPANNSVTETFFQRALKDL